MKQLGDITKLSGGEVPAVDVVIGGSPCQDLSVAGKRAGLSGERSGLYMEQIRIIKEMRERDKAAGRTGRFVRPRYMVWENVPGAFSSSKGEDFRAVLEEAARIADESTVIPGPPKGKWRTAGCIMGDGFSIAWRVLDAQFWGVPQRRRRIALVADFGGQSAPEILFVRESVPRDPEPGGTEGKGIAGDVEESTGSPVWCLRGNGIDRADTAGCNGKGWTEGKCYTLNTIDRPAICAGFLDNGAKAYGIGYAVEQSPTLTSQKHDAMVLCLNDKGGSVMGISENVSGTLRAQEHGHQPTILDMAHACDVIRDCVGTSLSLQTRMGTGGNQVPLVAYGIGNGQVNEAATPAFEKAQTLNTMHDAQAVFCAAVDCRNGTENTDVNGTLQAKSNGGTSYNLQNVVRENMLVRRLTPLECERLQGFPGGWTDIGDWVDSKGKKRQTTDSARYKALGNSIALLPWRWVLKRLSAQYERDATMASLFDGIGGFPLIWEQLNRRGSCLWASEIDEFPIAVAKYHFGED